MLQKKDELYNKSIQQFISILTNIKLQMRLNPEKAEENINEVIILLRNQIIIPEVKASPPIRKTQKSFSDSENPDRIFLKQKSSKEIKVEKVPIVEEQKNPELFVSADKIKE